MASMGYSTSTTGPITRATLPVAPPEPVSLVSSTVAVMSLSLTALLPGCLCCVGKRVQSPTSVLSEPRPLSGLCLGVGQRVHATDDLADLLGDAGLTGLVGNPGVLLDELVRVVGRGLHGLLPGGQLGSSRLEQCVED